MALSKGGARNESFQSEAAVKGRTLKGKKIPNPHCAWGKRSQEEPKRGGGFGFERATGVKRVGLKCWRACSAVPAPRAGQEEDRKHCRNHLRECPSATETKKTQLSKRCASSGELNPSATWAAPEKSSKKQRTQKSVELLQQGKGRTMGGKGIRRQAVMANGGKAMTTARSPRVAHVRHQETRRRECIGERKRSGT